MGPVDAAILGKLRRACDLWARGEKSLAQIDLAQLRLPRIDETQAFRLHLADRLMAEGFSPRELCKQLGFELPAGLKKYSPDQPRDERGRWTVDGDLGSASSGDVREGRSVSPGGHRGGEESEDDKLEDFKSKFGEDYAARRFGARPADRSARPDADAVRRDAAGRSAGRPAVENGAFGERLLNPQVRAGTRNCRAAEQRRRPCLSNCRAANR